LKRTLIWVVTLAVGVAIGFGLGAITFRSPQPTLPQASSPPPSPVATGAGIMPPLIGLQRTDAEVKLRAAGILFKVVPVQPQAQASAGRVLAQHPAAGTSVAPKDEATITVICVPLPCPTPTGGKTIYDPCSCAMR
jgi:hypothetical protein